MWPCSYAFEIKWLIRGLFYIFAFNLIGTISWKAYGLRCFKRNCHVACGEIVCLYGLAHIQHLHAIHKTPNQNLASQKEAVYERMQGWNKLTVLIAQRHPNQTKLRGIHMLSCAMLWRPSHYQTGTRTRTTNLPKTTFRFVIELNL